jgi:hypothetical protein
MLSTVVLCGVKVVLWAEKVKVVLCAEKVKVV